MKNTPPPPPDSEQLDEWKVRAADVPPIAPEGFVNPLEDGSETVSGPEELTALRLRLRSNGYHPVPVVGAHVPTNSAGKRPTMAAWATECLNATRATIESWSGSQPDCTNTGLLCGEIVGVDIDVLDAALSARFVARASELFGHSPLRRIGRAPKTLLVYRVETPHRKLSTPDLFFGGDPENKEAKAKVEIMADGQQFVGFGIHPDTRAPYYWPERSPLDTATSDIPLVTFDALKQFITEAEQILRDAGCRTKREIKDRNKQTETRNREGGIFAGLRGADRPSREEVADALDHIPNDMDYDEWVRIGFALYDGLGDSGRDLWERWSAQSHNNDPHLTARKWPSFARGKSVKIGTVFWLAAQHGWRRSSARGSGYQSSPGGEGHTPNDAPTQALQFDDFYAYMLEHKYIYAPLGAVWPAASVDARLPAVGKLKASTWLDKNRPVEQMTWVPGEPIEIKDRLIVNGGWIEREGSRAFNLYRAPVLKPTAGNADRWVHHVERLYGEDAAHIVKWCAHRVQKPADKINHALVLGGKQGIGKDTMLEPVKYAVGAWNFNEVSPVQILGRFNGFLKSVVLRVSEARDLGESDRFAFYDHMKAITAAPPDVLRIDEKNRQEYSIPNVCGVIITTNHKSDGIYLPADDRRHFVGWSDLDKSAFDAAYFPGLYQWYSEGGFDVVANYLQNLDLTGFNSKAPPPKTNAFWEIVNSSRTPEDAEFADALDALGWPNALTIADIRGATPRGDFIDYLDDRKNSRRIPHRLEACGYTPERNRDAEDGLWRLRGRRQMIYASNKLDQRARLAAARAL